MLNRAFIKKQEWFLTILLGLIVIFSILMVYLSRVIVSTKTQSIDNSSFYLLLGSLSPVLVAFIVSLLLSIQSFKLGVPKIVLSERAGLYLLLLSIFIYLASIAMYNPFAIFDNELRRLVRYESKIGLLTPINTALFYSSLVLLFNSRYKSIALFFSLFLPIFLYARSMLAVVLIMKISKIVLSARDIASAWKYIFWGALFAVILLSIMGTFRESGDFSMIEYSGYDVGSEAVAWFLAYTLINFDNLYLILDNPINEHAVASFPYIVKLQEFLGIIKAPDYEAGVIFDYVGGLNLGTASRSFIVDFGYSKGLVIQSLLAVFYTYSAHRFIRRNIPSAVIFSLLPIIMHVILNYYSDPIFIFTILFLNLVKLKC